MKKKTWIICGYYWDGEHSWTLLTATDGSGKTKFAEALEQFLTARDYRTQLINLDDFHNPKVYRYSGENQIENYYNKSFNIETIINKLLIPLNQKRIFSTRLTMLDWKTDKYEIEKEFSFHKNTIVIFEGVFLFRKELSPYIDYKIFIEIPFDESLQRAKTRDSEEVFKKYNEKYLPAQRRYLDEYPPTKIADMIINNSSWEYPKVKLLR